VPRSTRLLAGFLLTLPLASCRCDELQPASRSLALPEAASFPEAWIGYEEGLAIKLTSTGTGHVRVLGVALAADAVGLTLESNAPFDLPGGGTRDLRLLWRPIDTAPLDAILLVTTDLDIEPVRTVAIGGLARRAPACDDGNGCTDDTFDRVAGRCLHPSRGGPCDDGNACTRDDHCDTNASCRGTAVTCNDGDTCTLDLCDPLAGCRFPPDTTRCDDGDPCTRNVCDRTNGCAHPPSDDGTSCGPLDCATAHLCVAGACRVLDVTGRSDGLPCEDGDRCTEGDTCRAGACETGERVDTEPRVIHRIGLPTPVLGLAHDGPRIALAAPGRFVVGVPNRDRIDRAGVLALSGLSAGPVSLGNARFAVVVDGSVVVSINAAAPGAPSVEWSVTPSESGFGSGPIVGMAAVPAGLVLYRRTMDTAVEHDRLSLLPLNASPPSPGTVDLPFLGDDPTDVATVSADGERVLVSRTRAGAAAHVLRVDGTGLADQQRLEDCAPCALAPGGAIGEAIDGATLVRFVEHHTDAGTVILRSSFFVPLPDGPPLALATDARRLVLRDASSVRAYDVDFETETITLATSAGTVPDSSTSLAGHRLLLAGEVALFSEVAAVGAVRLDSGSIAARLDAWAFASPTDLVDSGEFAVLAGHANGVVALDVIEGRVAPVPDLPVSALVPGPWVLGGVTRSKVMRAPTVDACVEWPRVGPVSIDAHTWCLDGASPAGAFECSPAGAVVVDHSTTTPSIAAWTFASERRLPSMTPAGPGDPTLFGHGRDGALGLRASSNGTEDVTALRLDAAGLESRAWIRIRSYPGASLALDRDALLVASLIQLGPPVTPTPPLGLELYDLAAADPAGVTAPKTSLVLEPPLGLRSAAIVDVRRGRAWVTTTSGTADGPLIQVGFDPGSGRLEVEGRLEGVGPVRDFVDLGHRAVARTDDALLVIEPACR